MSAGTLTLTNDTDAVTGSGTAFTAELAAGDFIVVTVGGIPYTLPVKAVNNNTSLTLVSVYTGPTQSGAAWSAVPRVALNMVTAALVAQSAEALRGLNYDKQNWQQVYSTDGNITVKLPDGTTFTGPSWKYLSDNIVLQNDSRLTTINGKTGGIINGEISLTRSATENISNRI
ncbi:tail fiber domain-containing protein, partial [Salmonella enterica subsp. enterica serovar Schwarzengrund]